MIRLLQDLQEEVQGKTIMVVDEDGDSWSMDWDNPTEIALELCNLYSGYLIKHMYHTTKKHITVHVYLP